MFLVVHEKRLRSADSDGPVTDAVRLSQLDLFVDGLGNVNVYWAWPDYVSMASIDS